MNKKAQEGLIALVGIVFIAVIIILFMGFDYVPAGHIGVTNRMGMVGDTPWGPGVKWTGILTGTEEFSTRVQLNEYDASAASKDLQIVKTKVALNFKLNPAYAPELYKTLGYNYADVIITPVVQEAVKSNTAYYNAEELITKRGEVKTLITTQIMNKLSDKGLIVTEVSITDFDFSEEFNSAIERKQVAAQDALTAENRLKEMESTAKAMELQNKVIEIKKLDLQKAWIEKWNGQLPTYILGDSSNILLGVGTQ